MTEPTDSSMPPVMMTKAWPIEKMPNRPIRFAVLARLIGEQEARIDDRHDRADHQDQDQQAEILLAHRPLCSARSALFALSAAQLCPTASSQHRSPR